VLSYLLPNAACDLLAVHGDRWIGGDANADASARHLENPHHDSLVAELNHQLLIFFAGQN
jgi:hypothetical protein